MTESAGAPEERRSQPHSNDGSPAEPSATPQGDWRERAAFHVSIHSSADADGRIAWQTRAYHEERDAAMSWPGPPGDALIHWLTAVAELPAAAGAPAAVGAPAVEETPAAEERPMDTDEAADDFTQIVGIGAATARRLHSAGIRTYAQLAARSPAELAALLDLPPERITRRGWITRARALARLAELPAAPARDQPEPAGEEGLAAQSSAALLVEVLFDGHGEIFETRLVREGEAPAPALDPAEGHMACLLIEPAAQRGEPVAPDTPGEAPIEVVVELDDLELEELPGPLTTSEPLLRARSTLRLAGLGADQVLRARPDYRAYMLAYDLETGSTRLLHTTGGQLRPAVREEPLELAFEMPEIGRYQTVLVAILADGTALGAAAGPRLRVNP